VTGTATETLLPSPTETAIPTETLVPTETGTSAATPGETTIAQAGESNIVISEFRTRGPRGTSDEFVEIFNRTIGSIDISGWRIKVSDATAPTPLITTLLTINRGTVLQPGQHFLAANASNGGYSGSVTPDQTYITDIGDNFGIALTLPDGTIVDQVGMSSDAAFKEGIPLAPFAVTLADRSYERKLGGAQGSCVDTNNNAVDFQTIGPSLPQDLASALTPCNATPVPQATTTGTPTTGTGGTSGNILFNPFPNFKSDFFVKTIQSPWSILTTGLVKTLPNLLLAILLAIIFGFFALLLYDTLEGHEKEIQRMLGPVNRLMASGEGFQHRTEAFLTRYRLAWLGDVVQFIIALLVFGIVYSFVDPSFDLTKVDAIPLMLAMALSIGLINLFDDLAKLLYVRRFGARASVAVHGGNLVVAGAIVLLSRFASLTPGILSVGPGGFEGEEKGDPHHLSLIGVIGYAIPALVAWLLLLLFPPNGGTGTQLWLATILALIFAVGLQTVFFEMIPIQGFYGRPIFQRNKVLWVALFAFFLFLFLQTQLNPEGSFVGTFNKPNMVALAVFVLIFCLGSAAIWVYFNRRDRMRKL
jgi:hypothetical protein